MAKVFEKPSDLSQYLFRIVDNGGSSADRYTVLFSDGSYLAMSSNPTHPQGVSICGDGIDPQTIEDWIEAGEVVDLALGDLPEGLVQHIMSRNNEGLKDFVEEVESDRQNILRKTKDYVPNAVSPSRHDAEENDGSNDSLGNGIYLSGEKFMIKLDGHPKEDRGPFDTAREAILATLPDQHSFSGPELHSSLDIMRLTPDPEVISAVATLEARREAEYQADIDKRYG